jgi:transmembrane sensor
MAGIGFESEKIDLYFKGNYSDDDVSYINEVFCDEGNEERLKHHLLRQFYEEPSEDDADKKNLDHILYKIHYDINTKSSLSKNSKIDKFRKWTIRLAGIVILPLAIFLGIKGYINYFTGKEAWIEINAPAWTRAQFSLPDGSTVWLNSNSRLKYPGNFIVDRHVTLTGEAFFDVANDKKRPFQVTANEVVITVLGTRFNVASYDNEKTIEVVLEGGKLMFNDKEMNNSCTMNPNDLIIYNKAKKNYITEVVQPQKYIAWTEGKLVFRNDPIDVIARRLERWYNIDVEVFGDPSDKLRLRGTFKDENLKEILNILKLSLRIDYTIEDGNLKYDGTYVKTRVKLYLTKK